ncbi:MAG TPA: glycoside hydrolase family 3 C-terminal domain-containing protein [Steroidobacteraceae bacterium]|nr:glycoside hydrolase family 3 C-terminal domain-containing protein [Steroidobacteraceae bacterium]
MFVFRGLVVILTVLSASIPGPADATVATAIAAATDAAAATDRAWLNAALSADARADLALKAMTEKEKLTLVFDYFGSMKPEASYRPPQQARMGSAGYVPGVPRLGIPPQWITDASLGVATQRESADAYRGRTALPSGLATAATWNPLLARRGGAMIGAEARASGFNVLLGPGVNLVREARGGRDFEYAGEDPLLAGTIAGAEIQGIQSQHVIAALKHFAVNDQETGRKVLSSDIDRGQARQSDLLAFELAIEQGDPGSVMCAYNRVNSVYACQNRWLLQQVLKDDWGFTGYVMSDWGATHSTESAALAGLDQQSGWIFDPEPFFGAPLQAAVTAGRVPRTRLDDMARRILRAMFTAGLVTHPIGDPPAPIDFTADKRVAEMDEAQGIVLLKNAHAILPLARARARLLVIGGHADRGVISGGGSSTVFPAGGNAVPGLGPPGFPGPVVYLPTSPLAALMGQSPVARFRYLSGDDVAAAARQAKWADRVIVFATQWEAEGEDVSLTLPDKQDELIAAVAAANPHTIVVLETGGPVLMPWLPHVAAVLEAWYPGSGGGEAIAGVLFGAVDPSGRLPVTFPESLNQLPNVTLPGAGLTGDKPFDVHYRAGAAAGYKWYDSHGLKPLFPFGYGLSYTRFDYSALQARVAKGHLVVSFEVRNVGSRAGAAVPQVYVGPKTGGWEAPKRLAGWSKVGLAPGAAVTLSVTVDPRLLATFDEPSQSWRAAAGTYEVWLGDSSGDTKLSTEVGLPAWRHSARWPKGIARSGQDHELPDYCKVIATGTSPP